MSCILSLATELASSHQSSPSSSLLSGPSSVEEDIDKLKSMLRMVQAVLNDAEEIEGYETSLKLWLKELKGVAYNAEDLLKEYEYKVLPDLLGNRALAAASETSYGRKQEEEQQQVLLMEWRLLNTRQVFFSSIEQGGYSSA